MDTYDIGNHTVTVLSLVFTRVLCHEINSRALGYRQISPYSWDLIIWVISLHSRSKKMRFNKRNVLLETVSKNFLVIRSEVHYQQRVTYEANEHTFGGWKYVRREIDILREISI